MCRAVITTKTFAASSGKVVIKAFALSIPASFKIWSCRASPCIWCILKSIRLWSISPFSITTFSLSTTKAAIRVFLSNFVFLPAIRET